VVAAIACGHGHTLALIDTGNVFGFGGDGSGSVASRGEDYCRSPATARPVELLTAQRMTHIAAGAEVSLAINVCGEVLVWGATAAGIAGRRESVLPAQPRKVEGVSEACAIAAGDSLYGAIDAKGKVYTWGINAEGALGRPTSNVNERPGAILSVPQAKQIAIGSGYMLALTDAGELYGWGSNAAGQLGLGHLSAVPEPQPVRSTARRSRPAQRMRSR
jgi:alpha-tubulin suppressor-like RCC1 family protein